MKTERLHTEPCAKNFLDSSNSKEFLIIGCAIATIAALGLLVPSLGGLLPFYVSYIAGACGIVSTPAMVILIAYNKGKGEVQQSKETPKQLSQEKKPQPAAPQKTGKTTPQRRNKPEALLLPFYCESGKDIEGRTFEEILAWDDGRLESQHNYIQWLFPLTKQSQFNSRAPVLTAELIESLKSDSQGKERVGKAFGRMLSFYGLQYDAENKTVEKSVSWEKRKKNWVTSGNHNFLRITRILTFLSLMEMHEEKQPFFQQLTIIKSEEKAISDAIFGFWKNASGN